MLFGEEEHLEYVDEDEPEACGAAGEKADGVGEQAPHISLSLNYTLVISPPEAPLSALLLRARIDIEGPLS